MAVWVLLLLVSIGSSQVIITEFANGLAGGKLKTCQTVGLSKAVATVERIAVTAAYAIFNQPFHEDLDVAQLNREREIEASYPYGKEKEKSQEIRHQR